MDHIALMENVAAKLGMGAHSVVRARLVSPGPTAILNQRTHPVGSALGLEDTLTTSVEKMTSVPG
jgi:hypothetical protein